MFSLHAGLLRCLCALLAAALIGGCEKEAEEAPEPPAPPEEDYAVTVDELVEDATRQLTVLEVIPPGIPLQFILTPQGRAQVVNDLRRWVEETRKKPNGKQAIEELSDDLDARLQPARHALNGALVLLLCDLLEVVEPENPKIERYREWAHIYNDRPVVIIKGWMKMAPEDAEEPAASPFEEPEDLERMYAFCEVYLPGSGELHPVQVTEGEQFYGLEFMEIIGQNRGMRLRYLATGDTFEVYGPQRRPGT
jgi:hypothetical protein